MATSQQELKDIKVELGMLEHSLDTLIASAKLDGVIDDEEQETIDEMQQCIRASKQKRDALEADLAAAAGSRGTLGESTETDEESMAYGSELTKSGGSTSAPDGLDYSAARIIDDGEDYTYAKFPDGRIYIKRGPNGQKDFLVKPNTKAWNAIDELYDGEGSQEDLTELQDGDGPTDGLDYSGARIIDDGVEYTYAKFSDGRIYIKRGPNGQKDFLVKPNTKAWNAIDKLYDSEGSQEDLTEFQDGDGPTEWPGGGFEQPETVLTGGPSATLPSGGASTHGNEESPTDSGAPSGESTVPVSVTPYAAPPKATGTLLVEVYDQRMAQIAGVKVTVRGSGKTETTGRGGSVAFYGLAADEQAEIEIEFSSPDYTMAFSGHVERSVPIVAGFAVSHTIVLDTMPKVRGDEAAGRVDAPPTAPANIAPMGAPTDGGDASCSSDPKTFAQIYLAVQDGKLDNLECGRDHLAGLDRSQLETLDSVCERKIEFYTELARKQKADPKFKPPKGVPDVWFETLVREYERFRNDVLGPKLKTKRRTHKVPDHQVAKTIGTWLDAIRKSIGGDPIGCAVKNTLDLTEKIVEAKLEEKDFGFSDKNVLRIGYLNSAAAKELVKRAVPEGKNDNELQMLQLRRMVEKIRDDGTVLPLRIADKILESGRAGRDVSSDVNKLAKDIDDELVKAMGHVNNQQISATPGKSSKGWPANAIWYWFQQLSDSSQNPNSVYSCYAKQINAWTASGS